MLSIDYYQCPHIPRDNAQDFEVRAFLGSGALS